MSENKDNFIGINNIKSSRTKFCIECDCYLTIENISEWEVFIDNSARTFPICKECDKKRDIEIAEAIKNGEIFEKDGGYE